MTLVDQVHISSSEAADMTGEDALHKSNWLFYTPYPYPDYYTRCSEDRYSGASCLLDPSFISSYLPLPKVRL